MKGQEQLLSFDELKRKALNQNFDKEHPYQEFFELLAKYPSEYYYSFRFSTIEEFILNAEQKLGGQKNFDIEEFCNSISEILWENLSGDEYNFHPEFKMVVGENEDGTPYLASLMSDLLSAEFPALAKRTYDKILKERIKTAKTSKERIEAAKILTKLYEAAEIWLPVKGWIIDEKQRIVYHHLKNLQSHVLKFPNRIPIEQVRSIWNSVMPGQTMVMLIKDDRVTVNNLLYSKGFKFANAKGYELQGA